MEAWRNIDPNQTKQPSIFWGVTNVSFERVKLCDFFPIPDRELMAMFLGSIFGTSNYQLHCLSRNVLLLQHEPGWGGIIL